MTTFIKKKVEVEDEGATMTFRPGQFRREPFSLRSGNIYLLGMRASGKTTVGRALAEALGSECVDTDALVEAVRSGRIRASLDVTDPEPLPSDHPLWNLPGVFISPL